MKKYMFAWCKDCGALQGCYYQHGEFEGHPCFLDPDCCKEPLPKGDRNLEAEAEMTAIDMAGDEEGEDERRSAMA